MGKDKYGKKYTMLDVVKKRPALMVEAENTLLRRENKTI